MSKAASDQDVLFQASKVFGKCKEISCASHTPIQVPPPRRGDFGAGGWDLGSVYFLKQVSLVYFESKRLMNFYFLKNTYWKPL